VIFADETIFSTNDYFLRFVNCAPGEQYNQENQKDNNPHPPQLNGCGCFSSTGMGTLWTFTETMNGQYYKSILNECLLESADKLLDLNNNLRRWYLLHDSIHSGVHGSNVVNNWLESKNIIVIDFPSYSPDLNPIENMFAKIKYRMWEHHAETVEELQDAAHTTFVESCKH